MNNELTGSANSLPVGVHVGEYLLQDVVGEGGFGIVYRARDLSLDRVVAIKEYLPSTLATRGQSNKAHVLSQHKGAFDAGLRSFINEARLLAKFSHPALVHVYRFFEANGTAYMVMRYYEGRTFRALLADKNFSNDERWLRNMLGPILDGLEMLHAADCFHRDIAPDNILLEASGAPVLLDFGAARRVIGDMTQALTMVLKPGFAPIEQYVDDGGMPQGAWTDVYQLGAMLYLAITGKSPATAVARMIKDPVELLSVKDYPAYSAKFLEGVHRALAVKPQDRPQSVSELRQLLGISTFNVSSTPAWSASSSGLPVRQEAAKGMPAVVGLADSSVPPLPGSEGGASTGDADNGGVARLIGSSLRGLSRRLASVCSKNGLRSGRIWLMSLPLAALVAWGAGGFSDQMQRDGAHVAVHAAHWAAAQQAGTIESLNGYLAAYPDGEKAAEARNLLAVLTAGAAGGDSKERPVSTNGLDVAAEASSDAAVSPGGGDRPSGAGAGELAKPQVASNPSSLGGSIAAGGLNQTDSSVRAAPVEVKPQPAVKNGVVTLRVTPWGNVRVNRVFVGTTPPMTKLDLPEGTHQIEISNPAAPPKTVSVQVKLGEPIAIVHKFE